ncbi:hypothetical protein HDV04_005928 [Boothiomyces sp. JEL0838]|nr:hypothetical protein HDV04_005928 [Boothiomyces sp. JEL0838]
MIPIPAIPAALQNQLVEVASAIYTCSQDKRFGGLFNELASKIEFITTQLENFKSTYNPEIENKLKSLLNELNEILAWIRSLLKLSVMNRIVRLKKIVSKIKVYERQLDLHLQMFGILTFNLKSVSIQDLTTRGMENLEVSLKEGFQTHGDSIDQIMSNLGVFQNNIVENQEAIMKIIKEQMLMGYNEQMKQLLDHLQQKSGRAVKTEFSFKNISIEEVEFLYDEPIAVGSHGKALEEINGQAAADMIEKEFQLWYDLKPHQNVVPLLGACLNTDKPFLLMPFYQYGDVYSFISKNPSTSMRDRVGFILDIAYGMNHLHYFKIVHGDIKGDNVMLNGKFVCAITDFGLSYMKKTSESSLGQQRTGAVRWIAPERYKRGSKINGESLDIFAYAMTAYQILSGTLPFGEEANDEVVKEWIKDGERPDPLINVPQNIWSIITECWAHNPAERPPFSQITAKLQKEYKNMPLELKIQSPKKDESSTACNSPSTSRVRSNSIQKAESPRITMNALNLLGEASSSFSKTFGLMSSSISATIQSMSKSSETPGSPSMKRNSVDIAGTAQSSSFAKVDNSPLITKSVKIARSICKYDCKKDNEMSYSKGQVICVVDPRDKIWKAFSFGSNRRILLADSGNFEVIQERSVFSVEMPFYRSSNNELQLYIGDQVEILVNSTFDGWVKAKNIETGNIGMMTLNVCAFETIPTNPVINIQDFSTEPHISYMNGATPLYLEKSKNRWRLSTSVIPESDENPISEGSSMHFVVSSDFGSFDKFESSVDLRKGDVIAVTKVFEDRLTVQNLTTRKSGSIKTNLSSLSALKINEWETLEVTVVQVLEGDYSGEKGLVLSKKEQSAWQICILSSGEFYSVNPLQVKQLVQDYQFRFLAGVDYQPAGTEELAVKAGDCLVLKNVFEDGCAFATNVNTAETGMVNVNMLRLQ